MLVVIATCASAGECIMTHVGMLGIESPGCSRAVEGNLAGWTRKYLVSL